MKLRTLGHSGYQVSEIGLGCWQLGNDFGVLEDSAAAQILDTATEKGINFLDTADVYGGGLSEERIGLWLKKQNTKPYVVTKVGRDGALFPDGYTFDKVKANIEGSVKRLGVETLDLVQLHCIPRNVLFDGEIFNWMEKLQQTGLIRYYGASVEMLDEAEFCLDNSNVTSLQIIFNLFRQDATTALLPKAAEKNVGIIARLPLASGILSGKMQKNRVFEQGDHRNYNRNGDAFHVGETFNGIEFEKAIDLAEQAKTLLPDGMSLQQAAMRWILDQPAISSIIAGTTKVEQVISNAQASDLPPLDKVLSAKLTEYYQQTVHQHIRGGI
ncbi:aldo/keto reductase [Catenovulum sp. 2E275]|uniref:aldo/keto reductase n=1 Tax=Catenovulum sp. 2E275 TaxID=2980497 RepID=UPI0021CF4B30|nr:aldo/keto reductase [Catenovulum sp. 2E275]MCU4674172.1 aldo/keto reductase [Catenovulum sp. 2E275]